MLNRERMNTNSNPMTFYSKYFCGNLLHRFDYGFQIKLLNGISFIQRLVGLYYGFEYNDQNIFMIAVF